MVTLELLPRMAIVLDHEGDAAIAARYRIRDFYEARLAHGTDDDKPLSYLLRHYIYRKMKLITRYAKVEFIGFAFAPMPDGDANSLLPNNIQQDAGGQAAVRLVKTETSSAVSELAALFNKEAGAARRPILVTCSSLGSASRLADLLEPYLGVGALKTANGLDDLHAGGLYVIQWPLETGFQTDQLVVVSEPDIFGQQLSRPQSKRAKGDDFLREVSALETGDLVVHAEHGIGRYEGLIL